MIDVTRESLLTMEEAAGILKRTPKTVRRWTKPLDERKRPRDRILETAKQGKRMWTSREAIGRFFNNDQSQSMEALSAIAAVMLREKFGINVAAK